MFRMFFQGDPVRQATQGIAKGALVLGLLLIGFGLLLIVLKEIFIFIAAGIFFLAGFSAISYAIKLFVMQHKMKNNNTGAYRQNVEIHYNDDDVV